MSGQVETATVPNRRGSLTLTVGLVLVGLHVAVALLTLVWTPYDPTGMTGGRARSAVTCPLGRHESSRARSRSRRS